jgi:hypothetical protein
MSTESFMPRTASFPPHVLRRPARQRQLEESLAQGLSRQAPQRPWVVIEAEARRLAARLEARRGEQAPP